MLRNPTHWAFNCNQTYNIFQVDSDWYWRHNTHNSNTIDADYLNMFREEEAKKLSVQKVHVVWILFICKSI